VALLANLPARTGLKEACGGSELYGLGKSFEFVNCERLLICLLK